MKLTDFLSQNDIGPADFAARIGVSRQAVDRYIKGKRLPEVHIVERIHDATDGKVTIMDLYAAKREAAK